MNTMYSLETIRSMNNERAREAKAKRLQPYIIGSQEEINRMPPFPFPNIGSYNPQGWAETKTFFVDSSGKGSEGEMALTVNQFKAKLKIGYGYAITSEGQFQIYVTEYRRPDTPIRKRKSSKGTTFGTLTPKGVVNSMTVNLAEVKSSDPIAYSYGLFQGKSGQPMAKDKDLAPEYVRGYKDGLKQRGK